MGQSAEPLRFPWGLNGPLVSVVQGPWVIMAAEDWPACIVACIDDMGRKARASPVIESSMRIASPNLLYGRVFAS